MQEALKKPSNLPPNWKNMNSEEIIEKMGGWDPGTRAKFDKDLLDKNAKGLKKDLGSAPNGYVKRFAKEIHNVLSKSQKKKAIKKALSKK